MTKFTMEQKLEAVLNVLEKQMSRRAAAKLIGTGKSNVNRWVRSYEQFGAPGLLTKERAYDGQFKVSVVEYMRANQLSLSEASILFGVGNEATVGKWERIYCEKGRETLLSNSREIAKTRSKSPRIDRPVKEKVILINELRQRFKLDELLSFENLPRSTYYYHLKRMKSPDKYEELKAQITEIYHKHKGRYGYRRIALELRKSGILINHKTVQRLMGVLGLKSMVRIKKYQSYKGEAGEAVPNILNRDFTAEKPNTKWVTDITEFAIFGQRIYLSPILDLFNGEIISYEIAKKPVYSVVARMVERALGKLGEKDKPILHSDQGWQYRMKRYQHYLREKGIVQSMSRKGNCLDNAVMENFFGILKSELLYLQKFDSAEHFIEELHDYINYYNNHRIKAKLNGLSPVEYRAQSSLVA